MQCIDKLFPLQSFGFNTYIILLAETVADQAFFESPSQKTGFRKRGCGGPPCPPPHPLDSGWTLLLQMVEPSSSKWWSRHPPTLQMHQSIPNYPQSPLSWQPGRMYYDQFFIKTIQQKWKFIFLSLKKMMYMHLKVIPYYCLHFTFLIFWVSAWHGVSSLY